MKPTDDTPEPDDDLRIAEYVVGVLDAREREAVEALITREPEFAQRFAAWQERLGPLVDELQPVPTPDYLWSGIEARLGFPAEPQLRTQRPTAARPPLWESLALWRWLGVGGLAASLLLAIALTLSSLAPPAPTSLPILTATLQLDNGKGAYVITVDPGRQRLVIIPTAPIALAGKATELWLIAPEQAPVSLGLLTGDQPLSLALPPGLQGSTAPKAVFAVSLEPPGGSPTGQPTGPVVAKGEIFRL
jgi:anti-sigma-K factor RskA